MTKRFAVIVVAALSAASIIWLITKRITPSQQPTVALTPSLPFTKRVTPSQQPAVALAPSAPPSGWKILTSEKYKFRFSYPGDFLLEPNCNDTNGTLPLG